MEEDTETLDEVVVVGYGVQKKSDVTGAMARVTSKVIEDRPVHNALQAMQGRVTGVDITSNNRPGELGDIRIRGRLSFHLDIYGLVPHKTYLDRSIIRNILKCELTIKVGNCTICSTFHHHTGTDYRLTCLVKDSTRNGFALCKGPYSQYG